jgi:hypothetical protein
LLGHTLVHCPKSLTAACGGVVFIPHVADKSSKSAKHHRLLYKIKISNIFYNFKKMFSKNYINPKQNTNN